MYKKEGEVMSPQSTKKNKKEVKNLKSLKSIKMPTDKLEKVGQTLKKARAVKGYLTNDKARMVFVLFFLVGGGFALGAAATHVIHVRIAPDCADCYEELEECKNVYSGRDVAPMPELVESVYVSDDSIPETFVVEGPEVIEPIPTPSVVSAEPEVDWSTYQHILKVEDKGIKEFVLDMIDQLIAMLKG